MTVPQTMDVYFDYVCPFCLLAESTIAEVAAEHEMTVERHPFELRPVPGPTLRPEDDYLPRVWKAAVYPMAHRMGIDIKLPTISPQPFTHTAFEGHQYAREHGVGHLYDTRVMWAFFQEDLDIGSKEVLTDLAVELGLDGADFRAALDEGRYSHAHQAALSRATELGIRAVPTILVGSHRIEGVPDRIQLSRVISETLDTPRSWQQKGKHPAVG